MPAILTDAASPPVHAHFRRRCPAPRAFPRPDAHG
jgi:hypothetical protein